MKGLIFTSIVVLFSLQLHAGEEASSTMKSGDSGNRSGKTLSALVTPFGIGPSQTLEQGGALAYFISPNNILQIEVGDGNTKTSNSWLLGSSADSDVIHSASQSIALKHFVGHSFYIKGGIDRRHINFKHTASSVQADADYYQFDADSWSASLVIGNQFQWKNFTAGFDWIGASMPFTSNVNSEVNYVAGGGTPQQGMIDDMKSKKDQYLRNLSAQALRFYLGASF